VFELLNIFFRNPRNFDNKILSIRLSNIAFTISEENRKFQFLIKSIMILYVTAKENHADFSG